MYIAAAMAVSAIAGGISASQKASAMKDAAKGGIKRVKQFTSDQIKASAELGAMKQDYLEEGDPFKDMGEFIFGDPSQSTYSNMRKSQADFAALAAGDTSGFSREVGAIVSNAMSATFGGPKGSFENLSAKNLMSFRQAGSNQAIATTDFFGRTGSQLLNFKFGILDQGFDRQMKLKEFETTTINNLKMQAAGAAGTGAAAIGNVASAVGQGMSYYQTQQSNAAALADKKAYDNRYLDLLFQRAGVAGGNPGSSGGSGSGYSPRGSSQVSGGSDTSFAQFDLPPNDSSYGGGWNEASALYVDSIAGAPHKYLYNSSARPSNDYFSQAYLAPPSVLPNKPSY